METEISHLNLLAPLFYTPNEKADPFDCGKEEELFCFELDETQYKSIEPDKEKFLGGPVFCGKAPGADSGKQEGGREKFLKLPQGSYLFAQKREILSREEIIDLAIEIQLEGLWQRQRLERKLYLRYLYEDHSWVTQLFRPLQEVYANR